MQGMTYEEYKRFKEGEPIHLEKGGEGSGNFDHEGRPGQVGGSSPDNDQPGFLSALGKTGAQLGGNLAGTVAGWEIGRHFTPQIIAGIGRALGMSNNRVAVLAKVATRLPVLKDLLSYAAASAGASIGSPVVGSLARSMYEYLAEKGVTENTSDAVLAKLDFSDAPQGLLPVHKSYEGDGAIDVDATKQLNADYYHVEKGGPGSGYFDHEGRPGQVGGSTSDDTPGAPPHQTSQIRDVGETLANVVGGYTGYGVGQAADMAAGQALKHILPAGVKTVLTAAATKLPLAASILGFMTPGGIVGSLIGGAVAQVGVSLLLDWLEEKGVESSEDLHQLTPKDLAEAPTVEDAKAMAAQEPATAQPIQKGGPGSGFWGHSGTQGRHGGSAYSLGKPPAPGIQLKQQQLAESAGMGEKPLSYNEYRRKRLAEGWVYDEYYDEWTWEDDEEQASEPTAEEGTGAEPYYAVPPTEEAPKEEPQTYNIDQYNDHSQYAEAPNATDVSAPKLKPQGYGAPETVETPADIKRAQQAGLRSQFEQEGRFQGFKPGDYRYDPSSGKWVLERFTPGEQEWNEPKRRWEEKTPPAWTPHDPLRDPAYGVKDPEHPFGYDAGLPKYDQRPGEEFDTIAQAERFEELRQQAERAKAVRSLEPTAAERLESGEVGGVASDYLGQLYGKGKEYLQSWKPDLDPMSPTFGSFPAEKKPPYNPSDQSEPQAPADMPPYVLDEKGGMSVVRADGSVDYFSDARSGMRFWRGEQQPGDVKPVKVKEPTGAPGYSILPYTVGEPKGGYISTEHMPIPAPGIMEPYTSLSGQDPASLDPDLAKLLGEAREIEQRAKSLGSSQIDAKLAANDYFKAKRAEQLAPVKRGPEYAGAPSGGKIVPGEVPTLTGAPRASSPEDDRAANAQAIKNLDAVLPENIAANERKREQEQRDARAKEIEAQQREMDFQRKQFEHEQWLKQAQRSGSVPPTGGPQTPMSYDQYQQTRGQGGQAPATKQQPSAKPERPESGSEDRQGFMSYASKQGLTVRERGGLVYVTDARGKQMSFDSYDKAMRYYQRGQSPQQYAQKVQKDAGPMVGASTLEDDCARIGAQCMRGATSGRITIVITDKLAKQFTSEDEAQAWLNDNMPNVGTSPQG